jgi:DNA repair protein RecN (Recombination protein N)
VAGHDEQLSTYQSKFKAYKKLNAQLKQLIEEGDKAKADVDYYQFQFDELEKAALSDDEQELLEKELYALNNADEIKRNLLGANHLMQESENAALFQLREAGHLLSTTEKYNPAIEELSQRLHSTIIELKDIATEVEAIEQQTQTNPARADEVNNRLSLIYTLQKKHRVNTNAELLQIQSDLSDKIQQALFSDEAVEKLQKQITSEKKGLEEISTELSIKRAAAIPVIELQVLATLAEMGMANSAIKIEQSAITQLSDNGTDQIRFLFTANKGHSLSEMSKVASGGELSRLMLSIKSLIARYTALPTIIFDEIDTGVSGEVAHKVGQIMEQLAQNLQVITITHLPQIASKGQSHYFVYKDDEAETTYTRIKQLDKQERITEIAKMLSGERPGESAMQNAKELLGV